jgi:hypothetical protein
MKTDKTTARGFRYGNFVDSHGKTCSIQKSSACCIDEEEGEYIWLGIDEIKPKILAIDAFMLGLQEEKTIGWVDYKLPKEVLLSSCMHLSQKQVKELLPVLQYFAEHGELPNE